MEKINIGLGTSSFGLKRAQDSKIILSKAMEMGIVHIDTAETYEQGESEKVISSAISGNRKNIFLASKVWPTNGSYNNILKSCERSLKNLNTNYLDLYYLHWPSPYPLE